MKSKAAVCSIGNALLAIFMMLGMWTVFASYLNQPDLARDRNKLSRTVLEQGLTIKKLRIENYELHKRIDRYGSLVYEPSDPNAASPLYWEP